MFALFKLFREVGIVESWSFFVLFLFLFFEAEERVWLSSLLA